MLLLLTFNRIVWSAFSSCHKTELCIVRNFSHISRRNKLFPDARLVKQLSEEQICVYSSASALHLSVSHLFLFSSRGTGAQDMRNIQSILDNPHRRMKDQKLYGGPPCTDRRSVNIKLSVAHGRCFVAFCITLASL